ncbi:MAG: aminotransferase class I/II-fold pyridoxal phosphate-dependent enzyme [Cystobacterineae bacterium]|nr:aminotransferase class I/II-fold pyridoxal phosphate-dependent enzyme [Cystobacterineae bacterium]
MSDIAVIGMACRFPQAPHLQGLLQLLRTGGVAFKEIDNQRWTHKAFFDPVDLRAQDKTYVNRAAFIERIDEFGALHFGLAPRRVQVMDPQQRLFLEMTRQALEDAGLATREFDRPNTGVFVGASVSEYRDLNVIRHRAVSLANGDFGPSPVELGPHPKENAQALLSLAGHTAPMRAFSVPGSLINMVSAVVSQAFNLGGPSFAVDSACSSALVALHEAVVNLRAQQCNMAIAGGVYLNLTPDNYIGFARIGAMSPSGFCRPFDERADGFIMGEGVGVVVLKRLEDAMRDGDPIWALIRNSAANNDGHSESPMTPKLEGQLAAMQRAHEGLHFPVESIGFIETHGTATVVGDAIEVGSLSQFFAQRALGPASCHLGSIKANIGHTMSAAGIAGFIKAVLALRYKLIFPQPGCQRPHHGLNSPNSPFRLASQLLEWKPHPSFPRRAAVNAFGFGGTNAHLLLEEAPPKKTPSPTYGLRLAEEKYAEELLLASAPSPALLSSYARALTKHLQNHPTPLSETAAALALRPQHHIRLAFVASSSQEAASALLAAAAAIESQSPLPEGLYFSSEPLPEPQRRLAFLFPGQGAQRVGLLEDLFGRFAALRRHFEALSLALEPKLGFSLEKALFPPPPFEAQTAQAFLTQTHVCQPALAALSLSLDAFLKQLGLAPSLTLGHSLGEFVASASAGMLSEEEAVALVGKRGQLMHALPLEDTGSMLAVMAPREAVEPFALATSGVCMANMNHPKQVVLSGLTPAIKEAEKNLAALGFKTQMLQVSHAFHSPLMQGIRPAMQEAISALPLAMPSLPVISGISAKPYASLEEARHIWVQHATAPVDFLASLHTCVELGARHFVQLGAKGALLSFARAVAPEGAAFFSLGEGEGGGGTRAFLTTLGRLFVLGYPLKLEAIVNRSATASLPPSPIETQRYWVVDKSKTAAAAHASPSSLKGTHPVPQALKHNPQQEAAMENLIHLFREQMALLQTHADLLKAQTHALNRLQPAELSPEAIPAQVAQAVPQVVPQVPHVPQAPKPLSFANLVAPKAAAETQGLPSPLALQRPEVEAKVLDMVCKVSAFPKHSLSLQQTLMGNLGFDSLMLVELDEAFTKAFPHMGHLPKEMFGKETRLEDLVAHVLHAPPAAEKVEPKWPAASAELGLFKPVLVPAPFKNPSLEKTPHPLWTEPVCIVPDKLGIAEALASQLKKRGYAVQLGEEMLDNNCAALIHLGHVERQEDSLAPSQNLLKLLKKSPKTLKAFVCVSGLGGDFGLSHVKEAQLGQVGAVGFCKAFAQERPECTVKALDVDLSAAPSGIAQAILREMFAQDKTVELGIGPQGRQRFELQLLPQDSSKESPLPPGFVALISGGAKGLGALFAKTLAQKYACHLCLLGRSEHDENIEALLQELRSLGAQSARYARVDIRRPEEVLECAHEVRQTLSRKIDVLVHAAGVLSDSLVENKNPEALSQVVFTKLGGAQAMLLAAPEAQKLVLISSWAGRFGNAGQADYSAANAMLSRLSLLTPETMRTVAVEFPPWEDSEMAKNIPAFRKQHMQNEGVPFLSQAEGSAFFLRVLEAEQGEVVVAHRHWSAPQHWKATLSLSAHSHPFLEHHRLAGKRVLPLASAVDLSAQAFLDGLPHSPASLELGPLQLKHTVQAETPTPIEIEVRRQNLLGHVNLYAKGRLCYECQASAPASPPHIPLAPPVAHESPLPLSLEAFYAHYSFHGPRFQGIGSIKALGETLIQGWVHSAPLREWEPQSPRQKWAVDPLVLDASFQLAGYWAWTKHNQAGYPVGFERFVQLEPMVGTVLCTAQVEERTDENIVANFWWHNEEGRLVGFMARAKAKLRAKGMHFGKGGLATAPTPAPVAAPAAAPTATPIVEPSSFNIELFPEYVELKARMAWLEGLGVQNPYFGVHESICKNTTQLNGKPMLNFSSYNYVGNSGDAVVTQAAIEALQRYGSSVSASRMASGEKPLTLELERALARFFGTEDCIVLVSGHATNVSVIGHILGPKDLVVHDALAHDSIIQGAQLSRAKRRPFPHNDWQALDTMLTEMRAEFRRVLICIEGAYSMDGDIPDLPKFIEVKKRHQALLLVDEAHSAGTVGKTGRGIGEYYEANRGDVELWMGTLSKSFASCGGYIAGSHALVEWLKYTTPGFVYSVGLSPPNAAAALASLQQLEAHPERVQKLQANAALFLKLLRERGMDTGMSKDTPVVPAIVGNSYVCLKLSDALKRRAINVQPILHPVVEESASRLRFFLSSTHTEEELLHTAHVLAEELSRLWKEVDPNHPLAASPTPLPLPLPVPCAVPSSASL